MDSKLLLLLLLLLALTAKGSSEECRTGMIYPADSVYMYSYCLNGTLQLESCPLGSYFDAHYLMCRHGKPPTAGEDGTGSSSGKCQRVGLAGDLTNCNRFYYCSGKGADMELRSCKSGQVFDLGKFTCVAGNC